MGRIGVLTVLAVLLAAGTGWAVEPDIKCESDKIKTAGKYAKCLLAAESKAVKKGVAQTEKLAKCDAKYEKKWGKIETKAVAKAPPPCPTTGDEAAIKVQVQQFVDDLLLSLGGGCGGAEVGGACWFLGVQGDNCTDTCGPLGLVYDPATATYAGSSGTNGNCEDVLDALGAGAGAVIDINCLNIVDCYVDGADRRRCTNAGGEGNSYEFGERACACMPL